MDAGRLIHRIDLIRDRVTRVSGAEQKTPEVYATVRAEVRFIGGSEGFRRQQVDATSTANVQMRYRSDVLTSDRLRFRGKEYEIKVVIPDELTHDSLMMEVKG